MARVARVLIDSPLPQLDRLFDYAIPDSLAEQAVPGVRVTAALKTERRIADGLLVEVADSSEFAGALSPLESVVSAARVLAPEVWALARRVADRQAGGAGDVLRLAIPRRSVAVEKKWLAAGPVAAPVPEVAHPVSGYETGLVEAAIDRADRLALRALPGVVQLPDGTWVGRWALTLAQAAVRTVIGGASAILAVPDYRDQEQLEAALAALAPAGAVASLDARRTNAQRYAAFLSCLGPSPRIIVGNRSAVYAPASRLGLIALYDDGDPLFSEPLAPYAHTRDVALLRQSQQSCALVLAGHTRTVEVQRLVELGFLTDVPPHRAASPKVVPTAHQASRGVDGGRIPSTAYQNAATSLERGPVLVQVARPGYASLLACRRCGQAARCTHCAGPLQLRSAGAAPGCSWCGRIAGDWSCSECDGTALRMVTRGSGRTAEELGRAFPGTRVIVSDGERPLTRVGGEPHTLVVATRGAEPLADGGYAAVVLLDGERMLQRESLHVGDDCLRWWSNAAALAAAGAQVSLVGVTGPLAQALALWQQHGYATAQLIDRRILGFPPALRVASVTGRPQAVAGALAALDALEEGTIRDVLGPAPIAAEGPRTVDEGLVRAVVRFDYAHGQQVATALRGAVVRGAAGVRRPPSAGDKRRRPAPSLRVRMDDPEIL